MPWIAFMADFNYRPSRRVILTYRSGTTAFVPSLAAAAAIAAGAGSRMLKPTEARHERP